MKCDLILFWGGERGGKGHEKSSDLFCLNSSGFEMTTRE